MRPAVEKWSLTIVGLAMVVFGAGNLWAARVSDVTNTKHNLSATGPGSLKAQSESQVCVFCHTPHGATNFPGAPLWNRQLSNQAYTVYTSPSLDAETIRGQILAQPAGSSKLCLSCHDGTLAVGTVNVLGGQQNVAIPMVGTGPGDTMTSGPHGSASGFTRNLGTDLRNDHPISLTFDSTLAATDTELFDPVATAHIGLRAPGVRKLVPLEPTGESGEAQVQCATCHDPHVRDPATTQTPKFLRLNRLQVASPVDGVFSEEGDIVCLACHRKPGWANSAHALASVADEVYEPAAADLREFPLNTTVWQAACLNCHDPHTVHGARRLAREGTDSAALPKSGGASAIEETCYQCHSGIRAVSNPQNLVADIRSEFLLPRRMPITSTDQPAGSEVHDIVDADFTESAARLGKNTPNNRHAECTDCHHPHRVLRNRLFNGIGDSARATHAHEPTTIHSNLASGALRGSWGVEPVFGGIGFLSLPITFDVKRGDGGTGASIAVTSPHVTREYQVCLKCHSDYAYTDTGAYPLGGRPNLSAAGGGTPIGTNNMSQYTNQAMEFQAPLTHTSEVCTTDSGAGALWSTCPNGIANLQSFNHRSWHPVMEATGRSTATRQMSAGAFVSPWSNAVGTQTMYCSDCHGGRTAANSVVPSGVRPWGPHGSEDDFILKGSWNSTTGSNTRDAPGPIDPSNGICFKCHDFRTYADRNGDSNNSGFGGSVSQNLHAFHVDKIEHIRCSWCHTAVPHGWKNKALLVNLNDVGAEAGTAGSVEVSIASSADTYNQGPYYMNAKLKVRTFARSGTWQEGNCGSASGQGGVGRDWMRNVCSNPP